MNYPLAISSWDHKEIEAIQDVIKSNVYTMGPKVKEFEELFAKYVRSNYCVMVNSGSSANLLMIAALFYSRQFKLKRGNEVIVPAVSWATTYHPLQQYGLKLKFVDIDINTLNYNLRDLEKAVTRKTSAILAVNLLGNPNNFRKISEIISKNNPNCLLLEDNCESMGATFIGKQCGTFGIMGTFSTFFSHHMSTMEGGMIVTDSEELYHILLSLRAHGWTRNLPKHNHVSGIKSDNEFEESFKFVLPGYNVRPLEMEAAIGIEQLKKLDSFLKQRRKNAEYFLNNIAAKYSKIFYFQEDTEGSSWFGFSMIIKDTQNKEFRNQLIEKFKKYNIEYRPIVAGNFTKNPVMQHYKNWEAFCPNVMMAGILPNANHLDEYGLYVGNHHIDIKDMIKTLDKALEECLAV